MKKIALVFICIFFVSFVSAQLGFSNPKLPKLEAPTQTTTSSGGNSTFNQTLADTLYLRLSGSNQASWTPTTTLVPNLNSNLLQSCQIGASGDAIPLLSGDNNWTGDQNFQGTVLFNNNIAFNANISANNVFASNICYSNGTGCSTSMSYTNLAMINQSNTFTSNSNNSFAGDVLINGSSATQFQIINTSSSTPFFAVNTRTGNIGIGNSPSSAQIISATQNIGTTTANQQLFTSTQNINAKANNIRMFSTTQNWNWNGTAMSPSAPIGHVLFITQDNRRITSGSGDSFYNSRIQISRNTQFISSATSHNLYNQFWLIADSGTYNATSNVANKLVAINPSFNAFGIQNNLSNGANLTYDVVILEGEILSFLPKDNTANKGAYTYTLAKTIAPNGATSVNTTGNTTLYGLDCQVAFNKTYCLYDRVGSINYINGTLGIGTDNPNQKLQVVGNMNISGIIINQNASSWGGYGVCYLNSTYTAGALGHCINAVNASGSCNCRPN